MTAGIFEIGMEFFSHVTHIIGPPSHYLGEKLKLGRSWRNSREFLGCRCLRFEHFGMVISIRFLIEYT